MTNPATTNDRAADRIPAAIDAERYIDGVLVQFPDSTPDVLQLLRESDFVDPAHRAVFRVLTRQHLAGGIDLEGAPE